MSETQDLLRFGVFELNVTTEELRKSGTLIRLAPQPFKLLTLLARRSGQVVTREDIQQGLWGGETYVDFEQGMNHCIKQIRSALSDSADAPLYIETIPRRGYRFLAPVVTKTVPAPPPRVVESTSGIQTRVPIPGASSGATTPQAAPVKALATALPPTAIAQAATPAILVQEPPAPTVATEVTAQAKGVSRKLIVIAAVVLVVAVAAVVYWRSRKPAVLLNEKDTIVVTDFENTTGESVFDSALKQALSVDLEQSPFLNVLSDHKVAEQLRFMGLAADTRLKADVARQVCQRSGSKAMLVGSISGVGGHYVIGLKAIDCDSGDSLGSEEADAGSRSQVLPALGKAARGMRGKLGESLASVQKYDTPLEQATTPSLDALKAYSLGLKMADSQGYAASVPYFKSAIDLDPNFAMAHARLGTEYYNLNQPTLAVQYTTQAFELRDRTSEREKLYITSHYHDLVRGDLNQAIATYRLLQQAYPRDQSSYLDLTSCYNTAGNYEAALPQAKQALQLDPGNSINYHNLALTYIYLNRLDEAQAVLDQARSRQLAEPALLADLYEVAFLRGDTGAMAGFVAAAAGKSGIEDQLLALQSDTEAYHGRLQQARELSLRAQASATSAGAREVGALWQLAGALHEVEIGDPQAGRQQAIEALAGNPGKNVEIMSALVLARGGDRKRAESIASQLVKQFPADTMINDYWVPVIRAAVALDENNPAAAIEALRPTAPYEAATPSPGYVFYPVYLGGLAYLRQGQGADAAAEFQKMLKYRGAILNIPTAALARLQLARAQAMSGDKAAARKSYEEFLALWKDADEGLPILKQAQMEYAKVQGAG